MKKQAGPLYITNNGAKAPNVIMPNMAWQKRVNNFTSVNAYVKVSHHEKFLDAHKIIDAFADTMDPGEVIHITDDGTPSIIVYGHYDNEPEPSFFMLVIDPLKAKENGTREYFPEYSKPKTK